VRRLAERTAELPTEVRPRQARGARHVVDPESLDVAQIGQVLGTEEMPGRRDAVRRAPGLADVSAHVPRLRAVTKGQAPAAT
jgi:hypothetical protein